MTTKLERALDRVAKYEGYITGRANFVREDGSRIEVSDTTRKRAADVARGRGATEEQITRASLDGRNGSYRYSR